MWVFSPKWELCTFVPIVPKCLTVFRQSGGPHNALSTDERPICFYDFLQWQTSSPYTKTHCVWAVGLRIAYKSHKLCLGENCHLMFFQSLVGDYFSILQRSLRQSLLKRSILTTSIRQNRRLFVQWPSGKHGEIESTFVCWVQSIAEL